MKTYIANMITNLAVFIRATCHLGDQGRKPGFGGICEGKFNQLVIFEHALHVQQLKRSDTFSVRPMNNKLPV